MLNSIRLKFERDDIDKSLTESFNEKWIETEDELIQILKEDIILGSTTEMVRCIEEFFDLVKIIPDFEYTTLELTDNHVFVTLYYKDRLV